MNLARHAFRLAALGLSTALALPLAAQAQERVAEIKMLAPANGDHAGIGGRGWFIDLKVEFDLPLDRTGFTDFQLTGPGPLNNVGPMPGTFSIGRDDRMPGLVVLVSTTTVGAQSCQNIANLFNVTGVTHRDAARTELWDTWIVGAPNFGVNTASTVHAAIVGDKNLDGIYNDAPNVVPDANADGVCDDKDLKAFGVASNIRKASFFINP